MPINQAADIQRALAELMENTHTAHDRLPDVAFKFDVSPSHLEELLFEAIEKADIGVGFGA